ncbi:hypothetical protein NXS13_04080 [Corynebacterium sp. ES2730-CONJ]|uniref:DUF6928 family protein n=1 Tax=unclassified Corynebacterium TaxID=2624378 RepID=UPI00216B0A94|nr:MULTISPECIES: hypothetical protein [unclassified Corynebacterium]MCS4491582.1 hypothetical protein [Corynebacterium sp. ES2715-CONJ3]MCS4531686.1 hypothetical protein [Corynebacterium sp. ES2730-CONJ]
MVLTLWYVTSANPEKVISASPRADRGFGRKLLAQIYPTLPITPIGSFSLNHSTHPSRDEFYIAAFPGLGLMQTLVAHLDRLENVDPRLIAAIPAADIFVIATDTASGYAGFAHWHGTTLKRAFSAEPDRIIEDSGLVEPFESPYWAGEFSSGQGGILLPFAPLDLALAAQRAWLGFDPVSAPNINVVGYATDGRPEPPPAPRKPTIGEIAQQSTAKLGIGEVYRDYDDYEDPDEEAELDDDLTLRLGQAARGSFSWAQKSAVRAHLLYDAFVENLGEKLRYSDRLTPSIKNFFSSLKAQQSEEPDEKA